MVDAHVSGACAARCAGSSPALGTNDESLTIITIAGDLLYSVAPSGLDDYIQGLHPCLSSYVPNGTLNCLKPIPDYS